MPPFILNFCTLCVWAWTGAFVAVAVVAFITIAAVVSLVAFPLCVGVLMHDQWRERRQIEKARAL